MPASSVPWSLPLTRFPTLLPGQFGVPGTSSETGLRQHSSGAIFYVDPNHVDNNNLRDGTDPTAPLTSVATAITKCQPYRGDVIAVMANNANPYADASQGFTVAIAEEVTVDVPGVRIVGVLPSGSGGVVWTPVSDGGTCITVTANDVLIEGFYFTEGAYNGCDAISAIYDGLTSFADYLTVRNCLFDDSVDVAIQLEYTWYCQIYNNWFQQCAAHGIYVDPAGSGVRYVSINDNWFQDCAVAMALQGADHCQIHGNRIFNGNAQGAAVATNEGIDTTNGGDNIVSDNWFSCLLPVPANGDYDDLNTAAATDAWINNHLMNGDAVTNPT